MTAIPTRSPKQQALDLIHEEGFAALANRDVARELVCPP